MRVVERRAVGRAVAGVGFAVEAGAAFDGFGGADRHGEFFGHEGAESACPPEGGEGGGEEELEQVPQSQPEGSRSRKPFSSSGSVADGSESEGRYQTRWVREPRSCRASEALPCSVEAVVVEDVGGAEDHGVAVAGGGRDAQQGGQAAAGVAAVGAGAAVV